MFHFNKHKQIARHNPGNTECEQLWCNLLVLVEVEHIDSIFYICETYGNFAFLKFSLNFSKDRMRIIGAHLGALPQPSANKACETTGSSNRTRPPVTTHVLDTALGSPASGIDVHLEMWKDVSSPPSFDNKDFNGWTTLGSSITNNDGRSGQLMDIVDNVAPGFYRISFNTSKRSEERRVGKECLL